MKLQVAPTVIDIPVTRAGHTRLKAHQAAETSQGGSFGESWAQGQSLKPGARGSQGGGRGGGAEETAGNRGDPEGTVPGSPGRRGHSSKETQIPAPDGLGSSDWFNPLGLLFLCGCQKYTSAAQDGEEGLLKNRKDNMVIAGSSTPPFGAFSKSGHTGHG